MKLGDSMAPIEACNVWNDVCPRKARPPKIGDIPRPVAVDEESPGSSNARVLARINEVSRIPERSMLERSSGRCRSERANNSAVSTSLPHLETFLKSSESPTHDKTKFPINDLAELSSRSSSSTPLDCTSNGRSPICDDNRETSRTERPPEDSTNKRCVQVFDSIAETDRKLYEEAVADGVFEVRKDSALYIDERSLETLESLVSTGPPVVQRNVEEVANSRLTRPRSRRESSGYFSNLGTFDEDRWTACPMDQTNLQDAPTTTRESLLRERRRSSTKTNRLPTANNQQPQLGVQVAGVALTSGQQVNRSLLCLATDETNLSSSESDAPKTANPIAKSGRIEMPNIDEQPSLETNKFYIDGLSENTEDNSTIEADLTEKLSIGSSTFRNQDDSNIIADLSEKLSIGSSTFRNQDDSNIIADLSSKSSVGSSIFRNEDDSTIEADLSGKSSIKSSTFRNQDDSTIKSDLSSKSSVGSSIFRNEDDSTIEADLSGKSSIKSSTFRNQDESTIEADLSGKSSIKSSTFRNQISSPRTDGSPIEDDNNHARGSNNGEVDETIGKTLSDSSAQRSSPRAGAVNRQRRRMVVHQYSSPNITNSELERIVEKPYGEKIPCTTGESRPDASSDNAEKLAEIDNDEDDDDQVVVARHDRDESDYCRENVESEAREILPRSVKVYQLLSTQSEDRGDGDARLFDRRISLQIPRNNEEEVIARVNECQSSTNDFLAVGNEHADEKKLVHADSVPILKIPSSVSSTVEGELRLCVNERIPGSEIPTGPAIAGIRPIYPYCPYSPYASPQGSPRTNRRRPLRESRRVSIDSRQGALQLNQYKLLNNIGQGSYGIVKLAYNEEDETHYAMKILSKKKLMKKAGIFGRIAPGRKGATNPLAKVYREIALLKKLDHPNVVKLVEVLDDPDEDNLYLVFELVQKGEVMQLPTDKPLDEETARRHFRDVVMGVEYLHYQRIVHRDIKPSNLLVDSDGRVKVADLGVSAELRAAGELLSGTAGTPAFAAPETTTPGAQYSGTLCDVWSMGVTLYSLVTGKVPWDGAGSIIGVQAAVRSEPLRFPEKPQLSDSLRDLISRMLAKDPTRRMTLAEIKEHRWLTKNGEEPLPNEADNCRLPVTVTDEEVARVVTRVPKLDTLILIKTMLKQHSFQNPFLPRRIVKTGYTSGESVTSGVCLKQQESTDATDSSTNSTLPTSETLKIKTQQFHKAGRSNSAPDSYEWQTNGRQISNDPMLAPVTESSSQEAEVENR